jgi:phospholipid-transporting ATPase
MYDQSKDMPAKAQSSNLNEELGTIHYIFSDKTGTLTQNVMDFKKFSAGLFSYGVSDPVVDKELMKQDGITNVNFSDPALQAHLTDPQSENFENVNRFMEILSVCHTVIAEKSKHSTSSDKLTYNASSPDELALVNAAKFFGYSFKGRDEDNNMIVELKNSQEDLIMGENVRREYQLLNVIEFNSTRKRMSVIVRNKQDDSIHVMCKGADSIIIPLLRRGQDRVIKKT